MAHIEQFPLRLSHYTRIIVLVTLLEGLIIKPFTSSSFQRTLSFFLWIPAHTHKSVGRYPTSGRDGAIRTHEWRSQSPLPYRLATPLYLLVYYFLMCDTLAPPHYAKVATMQSTVVRLKGLEPPTSILEVSYSFHLNYSRKLHFIRNQFIQI